MIQFTEIHGKVTDMCFLYSLFSETLKIQNKFLSRKWYFCMFLASNIFMENDIWNKKNGKMLKYSLYLHKHINLFSFFFYQFANQKSQKLFFIGSTGNINFSQFVVVIMLLFIILQPRTFLSVSVNKWKTTRKTVGEVEKLHNNCLR